MPLVRSRPGPPDDPPAPRRRVLRGSEWRSDVLRTNLWLVPAVEVVIAVLLFAGTYALDRAAYDGAFQVPGWAISGSADAARQILTAIAAAIITVVGRRVLDRDRGHDPDLHPVRAPDAAQLHPRPRHAAHARHVRGARSSTRCWRSGRSARARTGQFVPHISITVTLVLMVADLAVLIYFLHHIAVQIQLPHVIAGIAADLAQAIELQAGDPEVGADAQLAALLIADMDGPGGDVAAPRSGYLQYIQHATLVQIATEVDAVIHLRYRPGHFLVQGHQYATVWPASVADQVARELARAHVTGPYRTLAQDVSFGIDQLVEIAIRALSTAVNDTFTALTCIDWIGDSLCKVTGRWQPTHVYRDARGAVRLIATQATYQRLVQRAFEKIRQAGRGHARGDDQAARRAGQDHGAGDSTRATAQVLLDQAAMIERLSEASVGEESDRADIRRAYQRVLDVHAELGITPAAPAT